MNDQEPFTLYDYQVPEQPKGNYWIDHLRWLICVMHPDDNSLHFIASVLSHALKNEGVTERQSKAAQKVLDRVVLDYRAGVLDCQINEVEWPDGTLGPQDLSTMKSKGSA